MINPVPNLGRPCRKNLLFGVMVVSPVVEMPHLVSGPWSANLGWPPLTGMGSLRVMSNRYRYPALNRVSLANQFTGRVEIPSGNLLQPT